MDNEETKNCRDWIGNDRDSMAALFTGNGYDVVVLAMSDELVERGRKTYDTYFGALTARGLVTERQYLSCKKRLQFTTEYRDLEDCEAFIESAFEDLQVKHDIYRKIEDNCPNCKVIASASSAMSPDDLRVGLAKYADKIVVTHPFNPPHLVLFVELVKSQISDERAVDLSPGNERWTGDISLG